MRILKSEIWMVSQTLSHVLETVVDRIMPTEDTSELISRISKYAILCGIRDATKVYRCH